MTNEQLQATLSRQRLIVNISSGIIAVIFILAFLLIICDMAGLGLILILGDFIVFGSISIKADSKIKQILSDNIISVVVKEAFGGSAEYEQDDHITPESNMFSGTYNKVKGQNHIKAVDNGLRIELSDLHLTEVYSDDHRSSSQIFNGQWLVCDFGKELSGEVFLYPYSEKGSSGLGRNVMMDNKAFNDRFCVKAKNPEEAFSILTPYMMECILKMADKANGPVYMAFLRNGKIHIAVNSNRHILELGKTKADYNTLHQKFLGELRWFIDMIDALRLEDALFKKETNV